MQAVVVRRSLAAVVAALLAVGIVAASPVAAADGPTVSLGDQSGLERDAATGSVFVPVYLSEPAAAPVVVSFYTVDGGSAVAGQDYTRWGTPSAPRTVTVPAGAVQSTINVPVLADAEVEDAETFSVVISSVAGAGALVDVDTALATIIDADGVSNFNPAITVSTPSIVEGDAGQRRAQFLIHLSRAPVTPVTVTYTTSDNSAVAGEDYVAKLPGTVVFAPGQTSKTIDVLVNSDTIAEGARDFYLVVTVSGGSPVEELNMTPLATILDDDGPAASSTVNCAAGDSAACSTGTIRSSSGNEASITIEDSDTISGTLTASLNPGTYQCDEYASASDQLDFDFTVTNGAPTSGLTKTVTFSGPLLDARPAFEYQVCFSAPFDFPAQLPSQLLQDFQTGDFSGNTQLVDGEFRGLLLPCSAGYDVPCIVDRTISGGRINLTISTAVADPRARY